MKKERSSIQKIGPSRYVLATSKSLTPRNKKTLAEAIGPSLGGEDDIFGPDDLNALLRKHPAVERSHMNLWLSSATVLETVLRSASHAYAAITKSEIEGKVRRYAHNPSFTASVQKLEDHHVLIISGPPGVGKTTLAEMLSYAYSAEAWELMPIRSLDDGFASIMDARRQVFLFDDFLGRVALDRHALAHKDSDLARLMNRIRESPNARLILTTRAYIFEEARRVSEHLADQRLDVSKYVLDVGVYTRRIKARILYNHLVVANTPQQHVTALVTSSKIPMIVDHKNYSPRVVEWMTEPFRLKDVKPDEYAAAFLAALENPKQLWDAAFRNHIHDKCRHLLFALFFFSEFGAEVEELRTTYDSLHAVLSAGYGLPRDPKDFEEALHVLEGSFIDIADGTVSYMNPSFRDYLVEYLDDISLLATFAGAARKIDWAQSLWRFGNRGTPSPSVLEDFASAFLPIARRFHELPVWKRERMGASSGVGLTRLDASNTQRIPLLLAWWNATGDRRFADYVLKLVGNGVDGFDGWLDGVDLVRLLAELADPDYGEGFPYTREVVDQLEQRVANLMQSVNIDELDNICEAVESAGSAVSPAVATAVEGAVAEVFDEIEEFIQDEDSESTLLDHISSLRKWAPRYGVPKASLDTAVSSIEERIEDISETAPARASVRFGGGSDASDKFDDEALNNLFAPLVAT